MRAAISLTCVLLCVSTSIVLADTAEDRLVEGELLEVSTGDLEKAAVIYRALVADEKTPEPVRARALLCLGRLQRKLGQLEAARATLEQLVKDHAKEGEVLRQAQSYLRELQTGQPASTRFDWMGEIAKNPEIQARVFEWAMQLVSVPSTEDPTAGKQLLALGSVALPIVDQMIDASRDPVHRQHLALIAARSGKLERLAVLLDPAAPADLDEQRIVTGLYFFLQKLQVGPEADRQRVLGILGSTAPNEKTAVVRNALLLACGDRTDFTAKLSSLEDSSLGWSWDRFVPREPEAAAALAARAQDPASGVDRRLRDLVILLRHAPERLVPAHWSVLLAPGVRGRSEARRAVERLVELEKWEALTQLAAGGLADEVMQTYSRLYMQGPGRQGEIPGKWGAVLRAAREAQRSLRWLHTLAERSDEAAVEFVAFLRAKEVEAPDFQPDFNREGATVISHRYAELLAGLLDSSDSVVLTIALVGLRNAARGVGPDILPQLQRLLAEDHGDQVRSAATSTLLQRFFIQPELGPRVAAALLGLWRTTKDVPDGYTDIYIRLLPHVLALADEEGGIGFIRKYMDRLPEASWGALVIEHIAAADTPGRLATVVQAALARNDWQRFPKVPGAVEVLRRVALDRSCEVESRFRAAMAADAAAADWFDWPRFLASDDPLLERYPLWYDVAFLDWLHAQDGETRATVLQTLERSERPSLHWLWVRTLAPSDPSCRDALFKALDDNDKAVRSAAAGQLLKHFRGDVAVLRRLLAIEKLQGHGDFHAALVELAAPELIEPLVQLLDHPDAKVRKLSLATLSSIRTQLEDKKEWQAIVEAMKARKKE